MARWSQQDKFRIAERRKTVASLYLRCKFQHEIAQEAQVDRGTVSRDGKVSASAVDQHQHEAHGLAWLATYAQAPTAAGLLETGEGGLTADYDAIETKIAI